MKDGCHDHGELPWGAMTLTSEKPILHYITHTEDSRKPLTPSESAASTCKQTRSRLVLGDRPTLALSQVRR